ncbi:MAG: hypothetical protein IKX14_00920 [Neisseriaceae bacterium]|nr:hypothetical protein [Neisseriaceae bacterium]
MNTAVKIPQGLATSDMVREAMLAEQKWQQTGLHITLSELKQWKEQLKSNPNAPLPKPHK